MLELSLGEIFNFSFCYIFNQLLKLCCRILSGLCWLCCMYAMPSRMVLRDLGFECCDWSMHGGNIFDGFIDSLFKLSRWVVLRDFWTDFSD